MGVRLASFGWSPSSPPMQAFREVLSFVSAPEAFDFRREVAGGYEHFILQLSDPRQEVGRRALALRSPLGRRGETEMAVGSWSDLREAAWRPFDLGSVRSWAEERAREIPHPYFRASADGPPRKRLTDAVAQALYAAMGELAYEGRFSPVTVDAKWGAELRGAYKTGLPKDGPRTGGFEGGERAFSALLVAEKARCLRVLSRYLAPFEGQCDPLNLEFGDKFWMEIRIRLNFYGIP